MPRYHNKNGIKVQFTAEEEAARDAEEAQVVINKEASEAAEVARKADVSSGKAKLKAGEPLTDAEVKALFG